MKNLICLFTGHVYDPVVAVMPLRIAYYQCSKCGDTHVSKNPEGEFAGFALGLGIRRAEASVLPRT